MTLPMSRGDWLRRSPRPPRRRARASSSSVRGWGRNSPRIAISASSFAARSSRPPLRNASTDSRRVLTSRVEHVEHLVLGERACLAPSRRCRSRSGPCAGRRGAARHPTASRPWSRPAVVRGGSPGWHLGSWRASTAASCAGAGRIPVRRADRAGRCRWATDPGPGRLSPGSRGRSSCAWLPCASASPRLLVVLTSTSFGEDPALLDLLVEAAERALERLVLTHSDFGQSRFTSSGRELAPATRARCPAARGRPGWRRAGHANPAGRPPECMPHPEGGQTWAGALSVACACTAQRPYRAPAGPASSPGRSTGAFHSGAAHERARRRLIRARAPYDRRSAPEPVQSGGATRPAVLRSHAGDHPSRRPFRMSTAGPIHASGASAQRAIAPAVRPYDRPASPGRGHESRQGAGPRRGCRWRTPGRPRRAPGHPSGRPPGRSDEPARTQHVGRVDDARGLLVDRQEVRSTGSEPAGSASAIAVSVSSAIE